MRVNVVGPKSGGALQISRTWLAAILVAALGAHVAAFLGYAPGDVYGFVRPWFRELMADGFSHPVGNYAPPYLYLLWGMTLFNGLLWQVVLIKLLSIFGLCWTAFAVSRVLGALGARRELALLTFALPSMIGDVSLLGQADTFWLAPCLLATAAAVDGRYVRVAAWAGLAFAVKAQAAFFAPFVIYLFAHQRVPLKAWLVAPAVFVAAWLPAWIMGWQLSYFASIYLGQFTWVSGIAPDARFKPLIEFVGNGASLWTPLGYIAPQLAFDLRWLGVPLSIAGLFAYWRLMPRLGPREIVPAAALSAAIIPFLLPGMLDRFFLLADLLAFTYALARPNVRTITAAVSMQIASAMPIWVWAFRGQPWEGTAFLFAAVAMTLTWRELVGSPVYGFTAKEIIA